MGPFERVDDDVVIEGRANEEWGEGRWTRE